MRRGLRRVHRWLGLIVAVQIVAWMVSGFYFSLFPIEQIRGEHLTRPAEPVTAAHIEASGLAGALLPALDAEFGPGWRLDALDLYADHDGVAWRVTGRVGERSFRRLLRPGAVAFEPMLDADDAARRARDRLREPSPPVASEWIEAGTGGHDLRGRDGPAWKVSFDGPEPASLYLDPWTGEVLARRTARWRLFDFLWMLHIMDYDTRENFNHRLLQIAALAGLAVALSGVASWFVSRRRRRSQRAARAG